MQYQKHIWKNVVAFHGHSCPGLALGMAVCLVALKELNLSSPKHISDQDDWSISKQDTYLLKSPDEEMLCIAETDACSLDAIQWIFSCTVGKGNLFLKLRGKHAYTFMHRPTKKAIRIIWDMNKAREKFPEREDLVHALLRGDANFYRVRNIEFNPPEKAHIAKSIPCSMCHEQTMDTMMRIKNGQLFCQDCFQNPSRIL